MASQQDWQANYNQAPPPGGMVVVAGVYPWNSPRMNDENGKIKMGEITWDPDPREGPYRPFYVCHQKNAGIKVEVVNALNKEQLKEEIQETKKRLCIYTFFCCCLCALKGMCKIKRLERDVETGNDTEIRNTLLRAKINARNSWIGGWVFVASTVGVWLLLMLPFVWIPYLIIALCL